MSIWKNSYLKSTYQFKKHITLNEGDTPFRQLKSNLFIKREDLNPTGSWKDRLSAFKVSRLTHQDIYEGVISSSGNAAISLINYLKLYPEFKLNIVMGTENVNPDKIETIQNLIKNTKHELFFNENAKKFKARLINQKNIYNLSSPLDDESLDSYITLGHEINDFCVNFTQKINVYLPVSSGVAALGLIKGLDLSLNYRIVCVQTSRVHPLVLEFSSTEILNEDTNPADAITDKSMLRKYQLKKLITKLNGTAYSIDSQSLIKLKKLYPDYSYSSLLSIAGFEIEQNITKNDINICIASGK